MAGNDYTINYYGAPTVVDNIPESFRIYDRRTAMLTKISEGRANLMRLLLNYAKAQGAYVATDTETRWGLEYARLSRIYFAADSTSTSGTLHNLVYVTNSEAQRLQAGDILNLMGFWVSPSRGLANATGQALNVKSSSYPIPEQVKIIQNY